MKKLIIASSSAPSLLVLVCILSSIELASFILVVNQQIRVMTCLISLVVDFHLIHFNAFYQ